MKLKDKVKEAVEKVCIIHYKDGRAVMRQGTQKEAITEAVETIMCDIYDEYKNPKLESWGIDWKK